MTSLKLSRRSIVAGAGLAMVHASARAQALNTPRRLSFEVWRHDVKIGSHQVAFEGVPGDMSVRIEAEMLVKFGPIPVFRYRHDAVETWRGGQFASLLTHTVSNDKREQVSATRGADGVSIELGSGRRLSAAANAHPLTHWNEAVLEGPLFNPQSGALIRERVTRSAGATAELAGGRSIPATRYALSGDAQIIDWYDEANAWAALKGKAPDGSYIDYRRVA